MATNFSGLMIVSHATDNYQASAEAAVCLGMTSGDNDEIAIFDFTKDNVFEDTIS